MVHPIENTTSHVASVLSLDICSFVYLFCCFFFGLRSAFHIFTADNFQTALYNIDSGQVIWNLSVPHQ